MRRGSAPGVALTFCHLTLTAPKPTPFPKGLKTIGDHLKKRRLELGFFQRDVAVKLGVSVHTIRNWEHDRTCLSMHFIPRIIAFLGYDPHPAPRSLPEQPVAKRRHLGLSRGLMAQRLAVHE